MFKPPYFGSFSEPSIRGPATLRQRDHETDRVHINVPSKSAC